VKCKAKTIIINKPKKISPTKTNQMETTAEAAATATTTKTTTSGDDPSQIDSNNVLVSSAVEKQNCIITTTIVESVTDTPDLVDTSSTVSDAMIIKDLE
jgi:hypothetical protein